MPKMKTKSAAKKRFTITATGKIKRASAYRSHILTSKSRKRKRKLRLGGLIAKSDEKQVRRMLAV
jgi:large subunit ribosomal protein L35